ncbi:hypothetical protein Acor_32900 [Acrocarpospora corrugata]|uniref:Uncharacterized protein n=1 Tax=Acrocarpospora corrugata TaxID=35763 RepID=A0A5M3VXI6_9ACTN|nr:hypothetical protein Acor_32900 [Acrocarpospora corrugata]
MDQDERDDERGEDEHLEPLGEEQRDHHEDHQQDGAAQSGGVHGAHSRSTAVTTNPRITKIATVRARKITSAIPGPLLGQIMYSTSKDGESGGTAHLDAHHTASPQVLTLPCSP